ncbi:hypothetical protein JZ751_015871 [Albula glossodonta]|uniref:Ig-like domain-containing protein n=1 Tax=Albula glossodonta TaxID=121402 RepID=A0A8T2MVE8_9TELE|nr:hypothetical protein JZ751_015871 [Albula glossodonta]
MALTWLYFVFGFCLLSAVLCSDWSVSMPQRIEVLSGSCVLIPCTFEVKDENRGELKDRASGVWRKGSQWFEGSRDVFNSSQHQNILQGQIVGDLLQKNCTTILHNLTMNYTDKYYFRIEAKFKLTFPTAVHIKVIASPHKPEVTSVGTVREGMQVNLTCSAPAPCPQLPPVLTWTPATLGDSVNVLLDNSEGTKKVSSTLSFTASYLHHGNIICSAAYPLQQGGGSESAEETVALNVLCGSGSLGLGCGGGRSPAVLLSSDSVHLQALSADNSPIYENASVVKASQGSKDLDEPVYNNSDSACASKAGYASHPPAAAENNYELYANSKVPFRK